jgi:pyruvate ferredoxin oxidoreductase delta subunit
MTSKWVSPIGDEGIYQIDTGKWRTFQPVISSDRCINCRLCAYYCPVSAIKLSEEETVYIDLSYCKGCGICATECPRNAIDMVREGDE